MISYSSIVFAGVLLLLLYCSVYSLLQNLHSLANRLLGLLCLLFAIGCLTQAFNQSSHSIAAFIWWYHLSWIAWGFYPIIAYHMAFTLFSEHRSQLNSWQRIAHAFLSYLLPVLYLLAVAFFSLSCFRLVGIGVLSYADNGVVISRYTHGPLDLAYSVYQYGADVITLATILIWGYFIRPFNKRIRRQASVIIFAAVLSILLDVLRYYVIPQGEVTLLWPLEHAIIGFGLTYAIVGLKFVMPTTALVEGYIVEHVHDMIILAGLDGTILTINRRVTELLEWQEQELVGRQIDTIIPVAEAFYSCQAGARHLKESVFTGEVDLSTKAGQFIPVMLTYSPVNDSMGDPIGMILLAHDLRSMRHLEREIDERKVVEEHLRLLHEELEAQIQQRTAELVKANADLLGEIKERERIEEALRESEQHYRGIFESIQDVYFRMDLHGVLLQVSPSVTNVLGYPLEDVIGDTVKDSLLNQAIFDQYLHRLMSDGKVNDFEVDMLAYDDSLRTAAINAHLVYDDAGQPAWIEGTLRDISERKRIELALRESEAKFRSIFTQSPISIMLCDTDGNPAESNDACKSLFGFNSVEELSRVNIFSSPYMSSDMIVKLQSGETVRVTGSYDFDAIRSQGRYPTQHSGSHYLDVMISPCAIAGDTQYGYLIHVQDVTERITAELALRDSEARFRRIVDDFPGTIWIVPADGRGVPSFLSRQVEAIFGYPAEVFLSGRMRYDDVIHANDLLQLRLAREKALVDKRPYSVELRIRRADGTNGWIFERGQAVSNAEGQMAYWQGLVLDITELKEVGERLHSYEQRLRALALELSLAQEKERRRLAVDLHDQISQQLVFTNMKLQGIKQLPQANAIVTYLDEVSKRLEELIRTTSTLTFELCPPILYELGINAAIEWLAEQFTKQHGLLISVDFVGQHPPLDNDMRVVLFRVLQEILTNVVKHANARHVGITLLGSDEAIRIEVVDDGCGIEPSQQSGAFGGFGLFSIRERLEYYNGRLEVESAPGSGTCVSLEVPLQVQVSVEENL